MSRALAGAQEHGVEAIAFRHLFIDDAPAYRETHLVGTGLAPLLPLWKRQTRVLAQEMIDAGFGAIVDQSPSKPMVDACRESGIGFSECAAVGGHFRWKASEDAMVCPFY